jgi:hypothetical protein
MAVLSRIKKYAALAAIVLGLYAVPAQAEPTAAEKASVRWLVCATASQCGDAGTLHDAVIILDQILVAKTADVTRSRIKSMWDLLVKAQYETNLAIADLVGADPSFPLPATTSRAAQVARAIARVDNVQNTLIPQLTAAVDAALAAGINGPYPYTLERLKSIQLAGTTAKLKAFNRTLAYADPYPAGRSFITDPTTGTRRACVLGVDPGCRVTVIGPHGEYRVVQRELAGALDRMNRAYNAALVAYGADAVLPSYGNKYQQLKFASLIVQKIGNSMGTIYGLQFSNQPSDPFFRMLWVIESLTHGHGGPTTTANDCSPDTCHGISYDFNNLMQFTKADEAQEATRPTFKDKQGLVIREITEVWQFTDTALWYVMKFPQCDVTGGCGGT